MRKQYGRVGGGIERKSNERYPVRGSCYRVREKSGAREIPRNPQDSKE